MKLLQHYISSEQYEECYNSFIESEASLIYDQNLIVTVGLIYYYFGDEKRLIQLYEAVRDDERVSIERKRTLTILVEELNDIKEKSEDRAYVRIPEVKMVKQIGQGCLPASVTMVMQFYSKEIISYRDVVKSMKTSIREDGTSIYDALVYLYQRDYQLYPFTGQLDAIKEILTYGYPLMVVQSSSLDKEANDHARILTGFDDAKQIFFINDPSQGRIFLPYGLFEELGRKSESNMCLLMLPSKVRLQDKLQDYFKHNCEYFNLMGVLYDEVNETFKSEAMYQKGLEIDGSYPDLFNNYAMLLLKSKDRLLQAQKLSREAIRLAPEIPEYRETLHQINELLAKGNEST